MTSALAPLHVLLEECERARTEADLLALERSAVAGIEQARRAGDRRLTARFEALAAFADWRLERSVEAQERALAALPDTDRYGTPAWRIDLRHTLAMTYTSLTAPAAGLPYAQEALRIARRHVDEVGHGAVSWSLNRLAVVIDGLGDTPRAIDLLGQAGEVALQADDSEAVFAANINIAALARLAADRARVEGAAVEQRRYAEIGVGAIADVAPLAASIDYWRMLCAEHEASLRLFLGDPQASLEAVSRHRRINERLRLPAQDTVIALTEVRALLELGRVGEARELADRDLDPTVFDAADIYIPRLLETRMLLHRALGEFEAALDVSEQLRATERKRVRVRIESQLRYLLKDAEIEGARIEADRLREQAEELEQVTLEDPLTGLANRRALDRCFDEWSVGVPRVPLAVAVVDIDHFKRVNDRFGHAVGDRVLRELAVLMEAGTRGDDVVARNGGEEFVVVLVDCQLARAIEVCERMRRRIREHRWTDDMADLGTITVSIGVTVSNPSDDPSDVLRRADLAMYRAKREGRDRLCVLVDEDPASVAGRPA